MQTEARAGLHPLVATASVAVIVLAAVGVAAFTGLLPGTSGSSAPAAAPAATQPAETKAEPPRPAEAKAAETQASEHATSRTQASAPKPIRHQAATTKPARSRAEAAPPTQVAVAPQVAAAPKCSDCGVVESVQEVDEKGQATGVGAVVGGVAGAVIGNQIGHGSGKTLARVLGAAGGAVVGHQVERNARASKRYDIAVRMEDGELRTVSQEQQPTWRAGDKVRVVDNALQAR